jgi:hypothetical protein
MASTWHNLNIMFSGSGLSSGDSSPCNKSGDESGDELPNTVVDAISCDILG